MPHTGTSLATSFNDALAQAVAKHPDRFSGLGAVAPQNPAAAAKELERCVTQLGLKGAIINSNTQGEYLDEPKFWDILAAAEALDVPIYLHPATPPARMIGPMIERGLEGAFYGFAVETSVHLLRMIMSGVFDRFPKLQIVAGHGGEGLPFWLWRLDHFQHNYPENNRFPHMPKLKRKVSEYMKENIPITTSGMFWEPVLLFCQQVVGMDRVMYSMDYPFQFSANEVKTVDNIPISDADKKKLYQTNAERDLQAVTGRAWARILASSSKAKVSANAGTAITSKHGLGRPAQRQKQAAEQGPCDIAQPSHARAPSPRPCRAIPGDRPHPTRR